MDELVSTLINGGKNTVASDACLQVCDEFKVQDDRGKKKRKNKQSKKKKKKKKKQRDQSLNVLENPYA